GSDAGAEDRVQGGVEREGAIAGERGGVGLEARDGPAAGAIDAGLDVGGVEVAGPRDVDRRLVGGGAGGADGARQVLAGDRIAVVDAGTRALNVSVTRQREARRHRTNGEGDAVGHRGDVAAATAGGGGRCDRLRGVVVLLAGRRVRRRRACNE